MKVALAQIRSIPENLNANIRHHESVTQIAISNECDWMVFPELSISGYEPEAANALAISKDDPRLSVFQKLSNESQITISIGAPIKGIMGTLISQLIFRPNHSMSQYAKQILHTDEEPYFVKGTKQVIIDHGEYKVAPSICYEALQPSHLQNAIDLGANCYLASVAKDFTGAQKAQSYLKDAAQNHNIPIAMVNGVGRCSDFKLGGETSFWNSQGELLGQLDAVEERMLMVNLNSEEVSTVQV